MRNSEVLNQVPSLDSWNLFTADPVLPEALVREGAGWALETLSGLGERVATPEVIGWGVAANAHEPVLHTHDRFGFRIDEVSFHPSYHRLMELSITNGLHSLPFEHAPGEGGRVARDAAFMLVAQIESGHGCPISMTTSVLPSLRLQPSLAGAWEAKVLQRAYDPGLRPVSTKAGATLGMGLTEKQGGSDVRANTSKAEPASDLAPMADAPAYRVNGHKWFVSAPMCDAFLILAQAPGGLTCFLMPRVIEDGTTVGVRNAMHLQRLKDKLGNRSNASSEIEFDDAVAYRVGAEGRGVSTIIEMVNHTRLDCVVGSTAQMRQAVSQAAWHCAHRDAFGARLMGKPLMRNVLADLEVEVEASTLMMMRLSGAFDRAVLDPSEAAFRRIATPVAKYWATKRCTEVVREAMECLGGNGYVEESPLPRLFRESPVNAIWEGSGNVIALDVLRALAREPGGADAFFAELDLSHGASAEVDAAIDRLRLSLAEAGDEAGARRLVEEMALVWQASLLACHGDGDVADAFVESRLEGNHGSLYGTLSPSLPLDRLALRGLPKV